MGRCTRAIPSTTGGRAIAHAASSRRPRHSFWQVELQPSPSTRLPSSHCSPNWTSIQPWPFSVEPALHRFSAASPEVPPALEQQLADGGRLVHPVGTGGDEQVILFEKQAGELRARRTLTRARFVKLVSTGM